MKDYKIGILTFHAAHNYGSMLQTYALQTYLQSLGYNVKIINLRTWEQKLLYESPSLFINPTLGKFRRYYRSPILYLDDLKKWYLFEAFIDNKLITTEQFYSYEDLSSKIQTYDFDVLICGSDQIWNQKCKDFNISYFLPFDLPGVKKMLMRLL